MFSFVGMGVPDLEIEGSIPDLTLSAVLGFFGEWVEAQPPHLTSNCLVVA
jgi:hypothetical protein